VGEESARIFAPGYRGLHVHPGYKIRDQFMGFQRLGLYDETLGWKLRPNATVLNEVKEFHHEIHTNDKGFRDDDHAYERIEGQKRILLIGDSFAMGDGVSRGEMFADRLETLLPDTEVVNLGVNGYGTDQELLNYQAEGVLYSADVVLLAFTLGNDVVNNGSGEQYGKRKPYFRLEGSELVLDGVPVPFVQRQDERIPIIYESKFPRHDWLDVHSALYDFVFHRLASIERLRRNWEESGLLHEQFAIFQPGQVSMLCKDPGLELGSAWEVTEMLLLTWKNAVLETGSTPAMVLIPSHLQVDSSIYEQALAQWDFDPQWFDPDVPNRRLTEFCAKQEIPMCDLLPTLREKAPHSPPIYYRTNPHWTREGHRLAAERIAEFLEAEGLWSR